MCFGLTAAAIAERAVTQDMPTRQQWACGFSSHRRFTVHSMCAHTRDWSEWFREQLAWSR